MRTRFLSTAAFLATLLFSLASFAVSRCDVNVPTERVDLAQVSLAYQSIGRASDPALLLVMGLGGQLIHWPDEVVVALCQQGFRVIRYDNRDVGLSTWRQAPVNANLTFEVLRYKLGLPAMKPDDRSAGFIKLSCNCGSAPQRSSSDSRSTGVLRFGVFHAGTIFFHCHLAGRAIARPVVFCCLAL